MKYSDFYEMDYIEQTKKLILNGYEFVFPLSLFIKRKDYYGEERTEWITINEYKRSDNWIWGDFRIEFLRRYTIPRYDDVVDRVERYDIDTFLLMIENNNKTVSELDKDDFNYHGAKIYEAKEMNDNTTQVPRKYHASKGAVL